MQPARFIRTLMSFLMVGVGGFMLGCSGPPDAPPVDKETGKQIAADMKTAQKDARAERGKTKEGPKTKDMMKNRKRGGPE
jgi:hypothetical protein